MARLRAVTLKMGGAECGMTCGPLVLSETVKMGGAECVMTWRVVVLSETLKMGGAECRMTCGLFVLLDAENGWGRMWNDVRSSCAFRH